MKLVKIFLLLCLPFLTFANHIKEEKSKVIHKTFEVSKDALVEIENKYGNINVTTWDKNTVEFDIKITVSGNDIELINSKLDAIDVAFTNSKNNVKAVTQISGRNKKNSGFLVWVKGISISRGNNLNFKIQYNVKIPKNSAIDFTNKYGNIDLPVLLGKTRIKCRYGNIYVDELHNVDNTIILDYSNNSTINYLKTGVIDADYSKISVEKGEKLVVNSDYTKLDFGTLKVAKIVSDYGSLNIDKINSIICNSDYTGIRLGTVINNMFIDTDYGNVRVKNFIANLSTIKPEYTLESELFDITKNTSIINGDYASIRVGTSRKSKFDVLVTTSYAGFRYPKELMNFSIEKEKSMSSYYKGKFGKGKSSMFLTIDSDYGSVAIKLND